MLLKKSFLTSLMAFTLLFSACTAMPLKPTPEKLVIQTNSEVITPLQTPAENNENKCSPYIVDIRPPTNMLNPSYSPNRQWKSMFCLDDENFSLTRFVNEKKNTHWDISYKSSFWENANDQQKTFLKNGQMLIEQWADNEQYVYLRPYWCCIDGPGMLFIDVYALYRLDLSNGDIVEIIPNNSSIRFSPDGQYLVYSSFLKNGMIVINVRDLITEQTRLFSVSQEYVAVGLFTWDDKNEKVIFVAALKDWEQNLDFPSAPNKNGFSLLEVNLKTEQVTTLIYNDTRLLRPSEENTWKSQNHMNLLDINGQPYILDIETGKLIPSEN